MARMMKCARCGAVVALNAKACPYNCGEVKPPTPYWALPAIMLAIVTLGWLIGEVSGLWTTL